MRKEKREKKTFYLFFGCFYSSFAALSSSPLSLGGVSLECARVRKRNNTTTREKNSEKMKERDLEHEWKRKTRRATTPLPTATTTSIDERKTWLLLGSSFMFLALARSGLRARRALADRESKKQTTRSTRAVEESRKKKKHRDGGSNRKKGDALL